MRLQWNKIIKEKRTRLKIWPRIENIGNIQNTLVAAIFVSTQIPFVKISFCINIRCLFVTFSPYFTSVCYVIETVEKRIEEPNATILFGPRINENHLVASNFEQSSNFRHSKTPGRWLVVNRWCRRLETSSRREKRSERAEERKETCNGERNNEKIEDRRTTANETEMTRADSLATRYFKSVHADGKLRKSLGPLYVILAG